MNCADARPLILAYLDHELDVVRSSEVQKHLHHCVGCAAQQESLQSLRLALRSGDFAFQAPNELQKKVARIASPRDAMPSSARGFGALLGRLPAPAADPSIWKWLALGAGALAVAAMLLRPGGISASDELLDEIVASHVRSLLATHLTDIASSDQHTVKPWFDGRLDFAPEVKDFGQQGFALIGGRLDYLDKHSVAALVYRHNKHLINVFTWPASRAHNPLRGPKAVRGYTVAAFEANGFSYWLVSDAEARTLEQLSQLLGKQ